MKPTITTLERPVAQLNTKPVLSKQGYTGTLLTLEPGAETTLTTVHPDDEQLLFVVEGEVTVRANELTTVINHEKAALLPPHAAPVVFNAEKFRARVLRVEIPARQVVTPEIISPAR